jgi:hypothetical protein
MKDVHLKRYMSVSVAILLLGLYSHDIRAQQDDFPVLTGPYIGQKPPGTKPELFAPGIVSSEDLVYANVTFSPDFSEACWTPNSADTLKSHGGMIISKFQGGQWTKPSEVRFLDTGYSHRSPFYSYNGKRLYFQGYLQSNQGWDQQEKFYFVERTPQGWSEPQLLDTVFNKYAVHWQFSLDKDDNLFFGGELRGVPGTGGIYISRFSNGKYQEPQLLFSNRKYDEAVFGPAISPDNSYIIFARIHPRGSTNPRIFSIYISFRKGDNNWSEPMDLGGKFNMDCNQPRISPDGRYIFFVGNDSQAYWVDANVIEDVKPDF